MPKLEPKVIQKELEQGLLWPVYWIYGPERMKARELLKRIKKVALGDENPTGLGSFAEENFDGTEASAAGILDAAQSPALGGGLRLITVREAQAIKEPDLLAALLGPKAKASELTSVCIFIAKELDGRRKFSKLLTEKAAVVPCEEVGEADREAWIGYLAKRRGMTIPTELIPRLVALDPWTLDIVDQELEKYSLSPSEDTVLGKGDFQSGTGPDDFIDMFFKRDLKNALASAETFADRPDEALPLLGLFAWNVRHLALIVAERGQRTKTVKLNPYVAEKLQRWSSAWRLGEILALQEDLQELDHDLKQTPLLPLGLWSSLVVKFCK
jgi:DNA polymerase III delta subunit